ncbi:hypothetical protein [Aerosakkonema sp. BLCC-F183]
MDGAKHWERDRSPETDFPSLFGEKSKWFWGVRILDRASTSLINQLLRSP